MIKKLFEKVYRSAQQEISHSPIPDYKTIIICITVAFSLSMIKYLGDYRYLLFFFDSVGFSDTSLQLREWMQNDVHSDFYQLIYWVSIVIVFYLLPPFLLIKFVFKDSFSNYGLGIKSAFKDYKLYLIMLLIMIPLVLFFSKTESFQMRYPFYHLSKNESWYPYFIVWELMYLLQFFALEFFFRGFMIHGTKQRFGFYSVLVMTIPYCMIHFGKPLPETLAAIIAGVVLGILSLKSKSIWLGVAIHYSVAITMDVCSLYQKGLL